MRRSRFWTATLYPGRDIWSRGIPQLSSNKHKTWPTELNGTHCPSMETGKLDCCVYWCVYIRLAVKVYVFVSHNNSSGRQQWHLSFSFKKNPPVSSALHTFSLFLKGWARSAQYFQAKSQANYLLVSSINCTLTSCQDAIWRCQSRNSRGKWEWNLQNSRRGERHGSKANMRTDKSFISACLSNESFLSYQVGWPSL